MLVIGYLTGGHRFAKHWAQLATLSGQHAVYIWSESHPPTASLIESTDVVISTQGDETPKEAVDYWVKSEDRPAVVLISRYSDIDQKAKPWIDYLAAGELAHQELARAVWTALEIRQATEQKRSYTFEAYVSDVSKSESTFLVSIRFVRQRGYVLIWRGHLIEAYTETKTGSDALARMAKWEPLDVQTYPVLLSEVKPPIKEDGVYLAVDGDNHFILGIRNGRVCHIATDGASGANAMSRLDLYKAKLYSIKGAPLDALECNFGKATPNVIEQREPSLAPFYGAEGVELVVLFDDGNITTLTDGENTINVSKLTEAATQTLSAAGAELASQLGEPLLIYVRDPHRQVVQVPLKIHSFICVVGKDEMEPGIASRWKYSNSFSTTSSDDTLPNYFNLPQDSAKLNISKVTTRKFKSNPKGNWQAAKQFISRNSGFLACYELKKGKRASHWAATNISLVRKESTAGATTFIQHAYDLLNPIGSNELQFALLEGTERNLLVTRRKNDTFVVAVTDKSLTLANAKLELLEFLESELA